jgi:hypothetical protein
LDEAGERSLSDLFGRADGAAGSDAVVMVASKWIAGVGWAPTLFRMVFDTLLH